MNKETSIQDADDPMLPLYQALKYAFDFFNERLFDSSLPQCIITFHRQRKVMGYASFERWKNTKDGRRLDEIAVNPEYFEDYPLMEIFQTICHEMAHIWQATFGTPSRRGYHNKEWAKKMKSIGLMPSSTGKPGGDETGEHMMDYVILDGPFMQACQELVSKGYELSWVDSFPIYRHETPLLVFSQDGNPVELNPNLYPKALSAARSANQNDESLNTIEEGQRQSEEIKFDPAGEPIAASLSLPKYHSTKPTPKSGKTKYSCRSCGANAWGKPGLRIGCLDCNIEMINID